MNSGKKRSHTLVSWIGHSDLRAMGVARGGHALDLAAKEIHNGDVEQLRKRAVGLGPLMVVSRQFSFSRSHLLCAYSEEVGREYTSWLKAEGAGDVHLYTFKLSSPADYTEVYRAADSVLAEVHDEMTGNASELCIHLSPGTPTMAAVFLLLGSTKYPATLFQSFEDRVNEVILPFELDLFVSDILKDPDRVLAARALARPDEVEGFERIMGASEGIRLAVHRAKKIAVRDVNVLLAGESGTGKELFARAIHRASARKDGPFVAINCAGIPSELLESEMFGYWKGAHNQALEDTPGAFEKANNGILFLDEVGELSQAHQAKLLRALQSPTGAPCQLVVRRLGHPGRRHAQNEDISADVRVIAATNRNLIELVKAGRFRDDLYYRLTGASLELPSLRSRGKDVRLLAEALLDDINRRFRDSEPAFEARELSVAALRAIRQHDWPGNVRELQNVLTQAVVFSDSPQLAKREIEEVLGAPGVRGKRGLGFERGENFSLPARIDEICKVFVQDAWRDSGRRNKEAARMLGIAPSTMTKYRSKFDIG